MNDELDPRLSAYLDGELSPAESDQVAALLASSAAARDELERVREARDLVRGLPLLEPPVEVEVMFRGGATPLVGRRPWGTRARARAAVVSVVATAAFWGVALSSSSLTSSVALSVDAAVATHTSLLGFDENEPLEVDVADEASSMPSEIESGFELVYVERRSGITHAMYTNGAVELSVFEQRGRVDWGALPRGTRGDIDGSPAWFGVVDGYEIVVVQRGRRVYTIVAETPAQPAAQAMPADGSASFGERLRDASESIVSVFSLR